jgi:hypothetical protein
MGSARASFLRENPGKAVLRKAPCDRVHRFRFRCLWTGCTRLQGKQIRLRSFY